MESNKHKLHLMFATMMVAAFISSLSQSLLTSALPSIITEFNISPSLGQWLTSVYILVLGVVTGITAWLINRINTKRLFLLATLIFIIGCITSMLAGNFTVLLLSRIVQAFGAGIHMPLLQVSTLRMYPVEKHGKMLGLTGIVIGFAPAIGPTISGLIVDYFGWRSIFIILVIISAASIVAGFFHISDISMNIKRKFDFISACLYGAGFCLFMYGATQLDSISIFSRNVLLPISAGLLCIVLFIKKQLSADEPFLDIRIFSDKCFTISTILVSLSYIASMSGTVLMPLYVQIVRGYPATASGLVLLPGSLLLGLLSPLSGNIYDKFGPRILSIWGMLLLSLGNIAMCMLNPSVSLFWVTTVYSVRMIGLAMLIMPMTSFGIHNLQRIQISHGTAILNSVRQMAGSLGSTLLVVIASKFSVLSIIDLKGINMAFAVQAAWTLLGLLIAVIFVRTGNNKK